MFFMLTLVLANNYLLMFVGWEGVGLCSYLLIGFWFTQEIRGRRRQESIHRQPRRRFRIHPRDHADLLDVRERRFHGRVCAAAAQFGIRRRTARHDRRADDDLPADVSSAPPESPRRFPLYVWLPDAMEGPTPVSALIHAATMVTAGVYMVARSAALFDRAPGALLVVAVVGAFTAIFAASIGLVQTDIKKVLAYSTVSQLGYMFLACGVGRLCRRRVSSDDACILQGAAVSRRRQRDSRHGRHSGHSEDGRTAPQDAVDVSDVSGRNARHCRHSAALPDSSART